MAFLRVVSFLSAGILLSACGEQAATDPDTSADKATKPACTLIMGWDPWEPYQFANVDGNVNGLDVELVKIIVENAGCTLEFNQDNWSSLLAKIQNGEIHLLAGATQTESRDEFAWFMDPYREESFVLYVRADEKNDYPEENLQALLERGGQIGVTQDYIYGDEVSALQDSPDFAEQFIGVPISELNYSKLADLEIDGFLEDPFVAVAILRRKGLGKQIVAHDIEIHTGMVHLMLSKASVNETMFGHLNNSLAEMKESGKLDEILEKYRN